MKGIETEFLDKLFAITSDSTDQIDVDIPLEEVPANLGVKLYSISEIVVEQDVPIKKFQIQNWPKVTAIAASMFMAIVGLQFYQQQQTLMQLKNAQADLATALHYLGEANRITQAQLLSSLSDKINKTGVEPARGEGRGAIKPNVTKTNTEQENLRL